MTFPPLHPRLLAILLTLAFTTPAPADPVLPGNVLDPKSPAEAWNVIRLATANVEQLLAEKRFSEITVQISFCSPALRALAKFSGNLDAQKVAERAGGWIAAVGAAGAENNEPRSRQSFDTLRAQLRDFAAFFDPKVVAAEIYFCPMHPDFVAEQPATPCARCAMALMPRRIPYSFIYMTPGQPSVKLTAITDGPIVAGRKTAVKVQLKKGDGSPVRHADLIVMHTQPIHLLIQDPSLGDYHHEHPVPTETPGEYAFTFTPTKTAPYRIWADLVPLATSVQELPFTDLPCGEKGAPIEDKDNRFSCSSGGLDFALSFPNNPISPPRAQQACAMEITITEANGQPVKRLEPLMNAFAHLVGFYEDYQTVVHLHPFGGEILSPTPRGGPTLGFKFFPPKPGMIRLYCQIQINGENIFAPFNVNVAP